MWPIRLFERPPLVRLAIVLSGGLGLTLLVYWINGATPPAVKLGLLYLLPVLFVTWYGGLAWGTLFAIGAMVLRLVMELEQQAPMTTVRLAVLNQVPFALVAGIGMFAFHYMRRTQRELRHLAIHDPLTRVLNARAFSERLGRELDRNRRYVRPMALLYLDLDNFKEVNDTRGHQTGDAVLKLVADAITETLRQVDVVGRMGGDEFAILMPETDGVLAEAAAHRLSLSLARGFSGTPAVTGSIGVVSCSGTEAGADELLRQADRAMYEAKRAGKNRVVAVTL